MGSDIASVFDIGLIPEVAERFASIFALLPPEVVKEAVPHILTGRDTIIYGNNGAGKTTAVCAAVAQIVHEAKIEGKAAPYAAFISGSRAELEAARRLIRKLCPSKLNVSISQSSVASSTIFSPNTLPSTRPDIVMGNDNLISILSLIDKEHKESILITVIDGMKNPLGRAATLPELNQISPQAVFTTPHLKEVKRALASGFFKNAKIAGLFEPETKVDPRESVYELEQRIPHQKIAPIAVEAKNGILSLAEGTISAAAGRQDIVAIHDELVDAAKDVREEIGQNHSRLHKIIKKYTDALGQNLDEADPARLGCIGMRLRKEAESSYEFDQDMLFPAQRGALEGLIDLHNFFVNLLPEWRKLVEEANSSDIPRETIAQAAALAEDVAQEMERSPAIFDIEIPATLRLVKETIDAPGAAGKAASFALMRSLENIFSYMARYFLNFFKSTLEKASEKTADAIASSLALAMKGTILALAAQLVAFAGVVPSTFGWLQSAVNLVKKTDSEN